MTEAAVATHTGSVDCPVLTGAALAQYKACIKASNEFSGAVLDFLSSRSPPEKAAWITDGVKASRALFQSWSMEILYVLAVVGRVRFSRLQSLLGLSSRTLSDKLQALREAGLVDRQIFDERPVRIEYFLTKHGGKTASLAAPIFCYLGNSAGVHGRPGPP